MTRPWAPMSQFRQIVREIHRRSLWQVLSVYLAGSWVAVQVVDTLVDNAGLPEWMPGMAIALLVIGFPIVMATAFIQEGVGHADGSSGAVGAGTFEQGSTGTPDSGSGVGHESRGDGGSGAAGFFTWKNAMMTRMATPRIDTGYTIAPLTWRFSLTAFSV